MLLAYNTSFPNLTDKEIAADVVKALLGKKDHIMNWVNHKTLQ
jgi:hypothetical protein